MIRTVPETGSTNADLIARLRAGEHIEEGDWHVADRQVAGRGRHGREWFDAAGNYMGSTVVRLQPDDLPAASLSFVAALAVRGAIAPLLDARHRVEVKWPNDVLLDRVKVAGILLEKHEDSVVIGIGVNLASSPNLPDRPTISLAQVGVTVDRNDFAEQLAANLAHEISLWRWHDTRLGPSLAHVLANFIAASVHQLGALTTVRDADGSEITGGFAGLEQTDGALCLRLQDGTERIIRAGDVILKGA